MESQLAYAFATDDFDPVVQETSLLHEVRLQGVGGGQPADSNFTGIKGLMLAVLEDGIRCFLGADPARRDEAEAWMTMRVQNWPFSFVTVCRTLGLEPSAVRRALRVMRGQAPTGRVRGRRCRPNVRHKGRLRVKKPRRRRP